MSSAFFHLKYIMENLKIDSLGFNYSKHSVIPGVIYITLTEEFINSKSNVNKFKLGDIYRLNAFSNDSHIFNIRLFNNNTSLIFHYDIIDEIVMDKAQIEKSIKDQSENRRKEIIDLKEKGKLFHPSDILEIANDIFGEDRVYIPSNQIDLFLVDYTYSLYIHFPILTITNSRKEKHIIKDLYVKFDISSDSSYSSLDINMYGRRLTLSISEFESNYGHSHMSGRSEKQFNPFCLGSSDFARLILDTKIEKTEYAWNMMLLSLENYLKWESIESGPYKYMNSICYGEQIEESTAIPYLAEIISGIDKKNWVYSDNQLSLSTDDCIYDYFDKNSKLRSVNFNNKKTLERKLKSISDSLDGYSFRWKDKDIKVSVYDDIGSQEDEQLNSSVVELYNRIIHNQFNLFNLKKTKDEYKQRNHKKIFGEISTVK